MNRFPVTNAGERVVCLFVEPYGEDFWLRPEDSFVVVASGKAVDPQFSVTVTTDRVIVWIYEGGDPYDVLLDYTVVDGNGVELECGHQRPSGAWEGPAAPGSDDQ